MVTLKHRFTLSCYCRCLSKNYTTALWSHQRKGDWERLETKKKNHHQWLSAMQNTASPTQKYVRTLQDYVWIWVLYICQKYALFLVNMVGSSSERTNRKKSQRKEQKVFWNIKLYFETYNNALRPHGCHIHNTASDMETETMCPYTSAHHALPYLKSVLRCCDKIPCIVITSKEENIYTTNTCPNLFMYTKTYHVVNCMEEVDTNNKQHVQCVPQFLENKQKNYTQGNSLCY